MSRPWGLSQFRAETEARARARGNPLADYDPQAFERQGLRGGSIAEAARRGIPGGWPLCECDSEDCPDREVPR